MNAATRRRLQDLGFWWRRRRINLRGLSRVDQVLVWSAIAVGAVAAAALISSGAGHGYAGGADVPPGEVTVAAGMRCLVPPAAEPIPRLATILPLVGLTIAGVTVTRVADGGRWRFLSTPILAFLGMVVASALLSHADSVDLLRAAAPRYFPAKSAPSVIAGWAGMAAAALLAISTFVRLPAAYTRSLPLLAGLPFALAFLIYVAAPSLYAPSHDVVASPCVVQGGIAYYFGGLLDSRGTVALNIRLVMEATRFATPILFFWFVIEGTRTTRDSAAWWTNRLGHHPLAAPLVLGVSGVWLVLGFAGLLPSVLGGEDPGWETARRDGLLSWLLAASIATTAAAWLVRSRKGVTERGFSPSAWAIIIAFSASSVLTALTTLAMYLESSVRRIGFSDTVTSWAFRWLAEHTGVFLQWTWVATLLLAGPVGIVLLRSERWRSAGLFLLSVSIWGAARAIGICIELLGGPRYDSSSPGTVEAISLHAALTVSLGALLAASRRPWFRFKVDSHLIGFVSLAVGILVFAPLLVPDHLADALFSASLVFPLVALLLWDAESLNRIDGVQGRAPAVLGLGVGLLCLTASTALTVGLKADDVVETEVAKLLFALPFLFMLVAASVSARSRSGTY